MGLKAWYDEEIVTGDRWVSVIRDQITACSAMIAVMTPAAEESVWVDREIALAEKLERPIYPLLLEGNVFFRLANMQYESVVGGRLPSDGFAAALRVTVAVDAVASTEVTAARPGIDAEHQRSTPPSRGPRSPISIVAELFVLKGHTDTVRSLAWSRDGSRIATAADDHLVCIWSAASGREIKRLQLNRTAPDLAWSPDGAHLALADGSNAIWVCNRDSFEIVRSLATGEKSRATSISWSPDGNELSATYDPLFVLIWSPTANRILYDLPAFHKARARLVRWSPLGTQLAIATGHNVLVSSTGKMDYPYGGYAQPDLAFTNHVGDVTSMAWSPSGNQLATCCQDSRVRVWGTGPKSAPSPSGEVDPTARNTGGDRVAGIAYTFGGGVYRIDCVAWSPSGTRIATASEDGTVAIWSADTGEKVANLLGHTPKKVGAFTSGATSLAWAPDGRRLVSGGADHMVRIWEGF
jgi:WD40 repeat protein